MCVICCWVGSPKRATEPSRGWLRLPYLKAHRKKTSHNKRPQTSARSTFIFRWRGCSNAHVCARPSTRTRTRLHGGGSMAVAPWRYENARTAEGGTPCAHSQNEDERSKVQQSAREGPAILLPRSCEREPTPPADPPPGPARSSYKPGFLAIRRLPSSLILRMSARFHVSYEPGTTVAS
jgi:hypothetical protein